MSFLVLYMKKRLTLYTVSSRQNVEGFEDCNANLVKALLLLSLMSLPDKIFLNNNSNSVIVLIKSQQRISRNKPTHEEMSLVIYILF